MRGGRCHPVSCTVAAEDVTALRSALARADAVLRSGAVAVTADQRSLLARLEQTLVRATSAPFSVFLHSRSSCCPYFCPPMYTFNISRRPAGGGAHRPAAASQRQLQPELLRAEAALVQISGAVAAALASAERAALEGIKAGVLSAVAVAAGECDVTALAAALARADALAACAPVRVPEAHRAAQEQLLAQLVCACVRRPPSCTGGSPVQYPLSPPPPLTDVVLSPFSRRLGAAWWTPPAARRRRRPKLRSWKPRWGPRDGCRPRRCATAEQRRCRRVQGRGGRGPGDWAVPNL